MKLHLMNTITLLQLFFINVLLIDGKEKRQLKFHYPQQHHQQQPQQFYGEVITNDNQHRQQLQQTVQLLPQSYSIQGIPIQRYDYFDADANSGVEEQAPIVSNVYKNEELYNQRTPYIEQAASVEGAPPLFSMWTEWSFCSRSCGGGVSMRSRECLSPSQRSPSDCGEEQLFQYMICNIEPCPNSDEDYRAIQCAEYNNTNKFGGILKNFSWVPYYGNSKDHQPCELRCIAIGAKMYNSYYKTLGLARDGTRCSRTQDSQDRYDMCVGGKCMRVGCDRILGSNLTEDTCGVCGGDNSSCNLVRRVFERTNNLVNNDYNEVEMIPKGATNIRVSENTANYLALMEASGEFVNYVINGNYIINWPGEVPAAGTMVRYERQDNKESIFALGPTKTDLYVMMLYVKGNPRIELEYWLSNNAMSLHEYRRRFKIVPNEDANFRTMPFIEPYSNPATTPVPPPRIVPVVVPVRTTPRPRPTTRLTTARSPLAWTLPYQRARQQPYQRHKYQQQQQLQQPITIAPTSSTFSKENRRRGKPTYCKPCKKTVGRKRHFCASDFVIHVQILSKTRMEGKRYRHDVLVKKVYKSEFKLMKREYIWVYSSCCPRLRRGREYLIMGRKRQIRYSPGSRGTWIQEDGKDRQVPSTSYQLQTRLVLDYMDYWRTWKSRYDDKVGLLAHHQRQQCAKLLSESTSATSSKKRDPEKRSPTSRR